MSDSKVVSMSDVRKEKQESLKREYERVLFNKILGCYAVLERVGLKAIEMVDISKTGCSFKVPSTETPFEIGEEIDLRYYFTNATFLPCRIAIKNVTQTEENGLSYWRMGGTFDRNLSSYAAIEKFVEFIDAYGLAAKQDKGDAKIWYL